ncbi:MAG TPA: hypothetical protein VFV95_10215 [Vicinamibacterales bacterium]|nr:hypothetical protein [Vicinamibacterales bacterium]
MFNKFIITTALAAACSGSLIAAQQPQTKPQSGADAQTSRKTTATVVGCVYREKDIPGRAPNVAERAGILEDYILAETSSYPSQPGGKGAAGTTGAGAPAATGTSGAAGAMYKLEFVDDAKLKSLVGKRVEAVGRIDAEEGDSPAPAPGTTTSKTDKIIGRDQVNLSEFEVSTIKEVAGTCPATPSGR